VSEAGRLGSVRVSVQKTDDPEPSGDSENTEGAQTENSEHFGKYRDYWGVPLVTGAEETWDDTIRDFKQYLAETASKRLYFRSEDDEERFGEYTHRFIDRYAERQYAEMKGFEEGAAEEYDDLTTVMLTFTASTTDRDGDPRPPVEHMYDVMDPWDCVRYELYHTMEADRKKDNYQPVEDWEYLRVLEPTTDDGDVMGGYTHQHVAIVVDGDVSEERFKSVIDKHVEKCPTATARAHEYDDVIGVHDGAEIDNLGAYLFEYLGKSYYGEGKEAYETAFDALLWHTGKRRFQPSDGAQEWMKYDEDEEEDKKEWTFHGAVAGSLVEEYEASNLDDFNSFVESLEGDGSTAEFFKFKVRTGDETPFQFMISARREGERLDNPPPGDVTEFEVELPRVTDFG